MKQSLLVLSASNKVPLLQMIKQSISDISLIAGDCSTNVLSRYFSDDFWEMPLLNDLDFQYFVTHCQNNNIKYVIPTREGELLHFSRWKEALADQDIHVMISSEEGILRTTDKLLFYETLKTLFPVIKTSVNYSDIAAKTFVVKEQFGAGSKNLYVNVAKDELQSAVMNMNNPVIQPYIKGKEYSIDIYMMKNGKAKGAIVRERVLVFNGESQITQTVNKPELSQLIVELAEHLKLYGHLIFQAIEDTEGNYHIIECNARFGGASTLSVVAGLDSFNWFVHEASGRSLEKYEFMPKQAPMTQVRYAKDLII